MDTVVLYPFTGVGHLAPMTEFAKLLVARGFFVAIAILPPLHPNVSSSATDDYISRINSSHPSISFHYLPPITNISTSTSILFRLYSLLRASNTHLRDLLQSISQTSTIRALHIDFFCTDAFDVASELNLPAYVFFTSGAAVLAYFLYLPTLYNQITSSYNELGEPLVHIPGLPPIPGSHMPDLMRDRDDNLQTLVDAFSRLPEAKGILVNSFEFLESRTLKTIREGHCLPGRAVPPVYCVGPLITGTGGGGGGERHECLTWLDKQPKGSVVFLCFGSMGRFPAEQVKEIATGLERSEQRFLWVVRSPPDPQNRFSGPIEPDLGALLPVGFVERTEGRGMVVKAWAPQKMNKVVLVEEMKLAVEMKGYHNGTVAAEEVETRVRWLMESEGGRELRERAKEMKEHAAAALSEGGPSHAAVVDLTAEWKGRSS
ncbi:hypothetical protein J5N97_004657 [Dioscorea zingiberensis]|uniref:Uncharacterized protein n=1 Tax=Dioscorea zingiberensis TaxID=325984 RepID=A0A9D5D6N8_9LILI|nr:hypothetical protein J5N97_004657 [Dioscorea zingiberensis]